jgi:hypothetical protein
MVGSRCFRFPRGFASGAAALGLHVGVGWGLGWTPGGEQVPPRAVAAEATLVYVDGEEAPAAAAVAASALPSSAPAAAASAASRPLARAKAPPRARPPVTPVTPVASSAGPSEAFAESGGLADPLGTAGPGADGDGELGLPGGARAASAHVPSGLSRSEPAHLLATSDPCADLFPYAARSDSGTVAVALDVATNGQPRESHIVDEAPRGEGFALAAHHCVRRLRFAPALDAEGHAVASRSVVRLRFARRTAAL